MNADVSIGDIPQDVLDEVGQHLQQFLVTIFVQLKSSEPNIRLIGSGTLVEVNQTHYILTAAHVWHETRNADQIGFAFPSYSPLMFPRDGIFPKILWNQQNPQEGPDLGLLRLPPTIASQIETYKTFLNLPKQKAVFTGNPTVMANRLWAVTGIVGEFSDVQVNQQTNTININCQERAFFGGIS